MTTPLETQFPPSVRIRSALGRLPEAERRVADLLLSDPAWAVHESVGTLAARAGASPATIVRFSRRLGYGGFAALKIAIAQEAGRGEPFGHPATLTDGAAPLFRRVMETDARAIHDGSAAIDGDVMARAADAIASARGLVFCGVGASAAFCALATFRFSALGLKASTAGDALSQHLAAGTLTAGDVCVAISHTGESRDTVDAARTAAATGAATIGLTSYAGSPLTTAVGLVLVASGQRDADRRELFANPVALISALGALHAEVAARRPAGPGAAAAQIIAGHQF